MNDPVVSLGSPPIDWTPAVDPSPFGVPECTMLLKHLLWKYVVLHSATGSMAGRLTEIIYDAETCDYVLVLDWGMSLDLRGLIHIEWTPGGPTQ